VLERAIRAARDERRPEEGIGAGHEGRRSPSTDHPSARISHPASKRFSTDNLRGVSIVTVEV
jgi:hypothetical protein